MQAIILAAGMGRRLKERTEDTTKCMVKVNGVTLIERMLLQLDKLALSRIIVVVGYKADKLTAFVSTLPLQTPVVFVLNDIYNKTNNIYSLYLAKDQLQREETLLLESDLIFSDTVLKKLIDDQYPSLALVAKYEGWMDGTVVTLDEENNITGFIGKTDYDYNDTDKYYKTVNIYKFSKEFSCTYYVPFLEAYLKAQGNNAYYEQVLKVIGYLDSPELKARVLEDDLWYEIDDAQDLDIAESLFCGSPGERLKKIQRRYGGYWRYARLIDFCYLVNPFYPPAQMINEIKANMEALICNYPSGLEVNNLVAAKCFGLHEEHICLGNGAAELINSFMKTIKGKIGIIRPTFEEYQNRTVQDYLVPYYPRNANFSYTTDDLIKFYANKDITALLLINPDNPSGNFIEPYDVLRLVKWSQKKGIRLIVDESFVDFSKSILPTTLLSEKVLKEYSNLVVVKSISKSYGVPGLRLGIIASADLDLIYKIKTDVSIWNINSIAEFYMQICEKYSGDYQWALEQFRRARDEFMDSLNSVDNFRVIPTQANFVMCEVLGKYTAVQLTEKLLCDYNILIKDLSSKKGINGQYVRIAVRRKEENNLLVSALRDLLGETLDVGQAALTRAV